jgi:hypothetical protein
VIKANLLHLSYNMWRDREFRESDNPEHRDIHYVPRIRFDDKLWRDLLARMAEAGMNMVVLDLGDAVAYRSHPEIAIAGAWSPRKLREELDFCRGLGIEPIPKLNFSACHDAWLGEVARKVSSREYYTVCADLIREVTELFGGPRFFHLGMDEETWQHQRHFLHAVVRQGDLWWHDLNFFVQAVEGTGSRAWVWSDVLWNCDRQVFQKNMPRTVLQSNWYYGKVFPLPENDPLNYVRAYHWLDEMGYEQVPAGSTWNHRENYALTVEYCRKHLSPERLLGFMMAPWRATVEARRPIHLDAIEAVRQVSHEAAPPTKNS